MNMDSLKDWLISKGIPSEELEEFIESPVIKDIGEGLMLSLQNDDDIGSMLVDLMMKIDALETRVAQLEGGRV